LLFEQLIMHSISLIFPHQLYEQHPAIQKDVSVYLVEEFLFFNQYNFHKQKLVLHRAAMKSYEASLIHKGITVTYIEAHSQEADIRNLIPQLWAKQVTQIHVVDVVDNWLHKRLQECCNKLDITLTIHCNPNFLNTIDGVQSYFDKKKTYFQTAFYTEQRKQRNLLLQANGLPEGGQWTFDADNRAKYPKKEVPPILNFPKENDYIHEAKEYVNKYFKNNYGSIEQCIYPITHIDAAIWLDDFLINRFQNFGIYEDAIVAKEHFLHHSVLSPMLNMGLLQPQQIIDKATTAAATYNVPLNSLEGFVRQIVGWREFIRIVYEREGTIQRTKNYWGFTRKIPQSFWTGTTGILPIDNVIKKVLKTGYCHHIERLMVLGNFMLLCEFDPNEVYRWFMELFVDAYDWVMVPNVYGMTQFADGGLMTTKPYTSGSNYLLKMSDYEKGTWTATWDGLFWRFMHVHRDFFLQNPRLGMLVHSFDKMTAEKQQQHLQNAEQFLQGLDVLEKE
jgi:deoxyribodipyrimidine photolyase-related protein